MFLIFKKNTEQLFSDVIIQNDTSIIYKILFINKIAYFIVFAVVLSYKVGGALWVLKPKARHFRNESIFCSQLHSIEQIFN